MHKKDGLELTLFGISFLGESQAVVIKTLTAQIESTASPSLGIVFTPNPEQLTLTFHDAEFASLLRQATWNLPDGQGIVWALKRQSHLSLERVPGRVVFHELLTEAQTKGWKVLLLGGRSGSGEIVAKKFAVQSDAGAVDIRHETHAEQQRVLERIIAYRPQVLFVAYGAPWQERWVIKHKEALAAAGVRLTMVVGGAFAYEAGLVPSVPPLVESLHLEWLWRLGQEPWRWRRQLRGLEFFWRVLISSSLW